MRCSECDRTLPASKGGGGPLSAPGSFWRSALMYAAAMALVTLVADLTPLGFREDLPAKRLAFIVVWALAMAWWKRRDQRADAERPPPSTSPHA